MAKVTLITSRDCKEKLDALNIAGCRPEKLNSERYNESFKLQENEGVVFNLCLVKEQKQKYDALEKIDDYERISSLVIPNGSKREAFFYGVYKWVKSEFETIFLASEYPYFEDEWEAKSLYLDGILDVVFSNCKKDDTNLELTVYSHDRDWDYTGDGIIPDWSEFDDVAEENKCLKKLIDLAKIGKANVILFQHKDDSEIYKNMLNMLKP